MKVVTFDGKQIIEPGAYAQTKGGDTDAPSAASFGNALFIDTGSMAKYGYGSGITGSLTSGANSIYSFSGINDFKGAVGGGIMWDASSWLFKPSKSLSVPGVQNLILVHARTTVKSSIALNFQTGGVRATGYVQFALNPANLDTMTINGTVFTFRTTATVAVDIQIGATLLETMVNAAEKLAQSSVAGLITAQYHATANRVNVKFRASGTAGNAFTLAASVGTPSAGTLAGGTAGTPANGGVFAIDSIVEGIGANGLLDPTSSELYTGFGLKVVAGTVDTAKFAVEFWRGTYVGLDFNSVPFNNITRAASLPTLITKSSEVSTLAELFAWADSNAEFKSWFIRDKAASSIAGTGAINVADLTTFSGYNFFSKGTETYSPSDLTKVYEYIKELDYSFLLSDKYETSANDTINYQHLAHINLKSEFKRTMYIGGGADSTQFTQAGGSIPVAATFNDENVHLVHSRTYFNTNTGTGTIKKELPSIYHAAAALGRAAGQTPQTPMTWKDLNFDGVKHIMSQPEREQACQLGVQHLRSVATLGLVINLDNNTKLNNTQDVYEDGTSPFGSIVRIKNLLNRYIAINSRLRFTGKNANTASPAEVKSYAETLLLLQVATKNEDNMILTFKNVKASLVGSDYKVDYGFTPNGPINRLFITGTMFSVNISSN